MLFKSIFKPLLLLFLFCWVPGGAAAQDIVKGVVLDAAGDPIIGATVKVKGTNVGAVTDLDGQFSVNADEMAEIQVSYIGYLPQEVKVGGRKFLTVNLQEEETTLSDVVVIGYGTAKRSDISGSVVSVDREAMLRKAPVNLAQGLQGAAPGVMVNAQDGAPDANAAIRIRGVATINGSADPLYVVDGVQVGTNANFLNPQDIENVEILKDASATAIYGARGANGVVMITTRHGHKGAVHVDVMANWGIQTLDRTLDVLDADTYAKAIRIGRAVDGSNIVMPVWGEQYDGQRKTVDWQKEMTRTALRQNYTASVSGGTEKLQGSFSAGYLDNKGIIVNTNYRRMNLRGTLRAQVNKYLEMGGDVNFTHSVSQGSNYAFNNNNNLSSLRDFATAVPTMDYTDASGNLIHPNVVNADGTYGTYWQSTVGGEVPKLSDNYYARQMEICNPYRVNRLLSNMYVDISPVKGLHLKSILSYGHTATDKSEWTPKRLRYNNGELYPLLGVNANEKFELTQTAGYDKGIETYLTYNWYNDIHNITVMAGNSVSKSYGSWVSASAEDFPGSSIRDISLTNDLDTKTGNGAFNLQTRFISYYGRVMYGLLDRYNFTATIRRDGSSNFGAGNRWGTFPSFAASWRISEEAFVKRALPALSNLKLRLGWGRTGNAGSATNLATPQLSSDGIMYHFYSSGASTQNFSTANGMAQASVIDTNLKWETNEQWNIGLDGGFFNNALTFTIDYFIRTSKDLLLYQSLRPSTGWNDVYTNYGEIRNTGLEFSLSYNRHFGKDWTLGATLTGSTLKNKIIKSGLDIMETCDWNDGTTEDGSNMGTVAGSSMWWNNHSICREGYAVGSYYGYRTDGLFTSQEELDALNEAAYAAGWTDGYQVAGTKVGDVKFVDLNGDGHISEEDMDIIGNGFPKLNFGLNLTASYKQWDASLYLYGVLGQDILSYSAMRLSTIAPSDDNVSNILKESYNDIWSESNPGGTLPRLTVLDLNHNTRCSDLWVKNGDFLKISQLQIGYTFPRKWTAPLMLSALRVYASISNLCCLSSYNKYGDPECGQGNVLYTGLDTGRYPSPRTYSFGLSVQF